MRLLPARGLKNLLARDHHTEIDNLEVVALQDDADDVFADVVDITFNSGHDDLAIRLHYTALLLFYKRYEVSDGFLHPLDTTEKFTETIYRLPHFLQWPPPGDAPPVAGLPADKSGTISFGSFNNPAKVTTKAIDLWAEILNSVAGSRLVFKYKGLFEQASLADRLARRFATHGIGRDRLEFLAMSPTFMEHLQSMGNVDIALDSFPFNGATTTFQVLWMGVPVVTLNGGSFVSRMTGSILHPLGLDEWAVDRPEDYRAIWDRHLDILLRAHTRTMEAAYEDMWLNWCKKI